MKEEKVKKAASDREYAHGKEPQAHTTGEGECRCKEVSKKRLPELIRMMIDDLAFWKKGNG